MQFDQCGNWSAFNSNCDQTSCRQAEYELLQTERNYVRDLEVILEVFKKPIETEKVLSCRSFQQHEVNHTVDYSRHGFKMHSKQKGKGQYLLCAYV